MIFLQILKIIGFVLLGILALVLLLLLIVLFWPIFYKVTGDYHGELKAKAQVTYLFHLVRVIFTYENKKPYLVAKVLWFKLYENDFSKDEEEESDENLFPEDEALDQLDEKLTSEDKGDEDTIPRAEEDDFEGDFDDLTDEEIEEFMKKEPPKRSLKGFFEEIPIIFKKTISKIREKWYTLKESLAKTQKKVKLITKRIQYYWKVLHHKSMGPAWEMVKKTLKGLFKHIKPYKMNVNIHYGADDPADTARAVAGYSLIYPYFRKQIHLNAEFTEKIFEADFLLKGRVQVYRLVFLLLRAYMNRHVRKIIRLFTREGKKNGRNN